MKKILLFLLILSISCAKKKELDFFQLGLNSFNSNNLALADIQFKMVKKSDSSYTIAQEYLHKIDSIYEQNEISRKRSSIDEIIGNYEHNLKKSNENYNLLGSYYNSLDEIQKEINFYNRLIIDSRELQESDDSKKVEKGIELERLVRKTRIKRFPLFRENYANILEKKLWEDDIEVNSYGNNHDRIVFVGGTFATNRNIKAFHQNILPDLILLRYKESRYAWINGDSGTTYSIGSKSDD